VTGSRANDANGAIGVVIADDNAAVRELLRLICELDGRLRLVGEAADGAQTLAVVAAQRPDVLLLDLGMPLIDGLQVLDELRASQPELKVVVYSGFAADDVRVAALAAGAADYLVKGVDPALIVDSLVAAAR
jgi:DNA-binding NarL/FixJ family response regulator